MRFTEREMTVAVEAVAKQLFAATRLRRGDTDGAWARLTPQVRYQALSSAGDVVLPLLLALPERPTVGAPPPFSDEEYATAAEEACRTRAERAKPGSWDGGTKRGRRRQLAAAEQLGRVAVAAMPIRQDPDALVVPDHL